MSDGSNPAANRHTVTVTVQVRAIAIRVTV